MLTFTDDLTGEVLAHIDGPDAVMNANATVDTVLATRGASASIASFAAIEQ